jgi:hypothetical protein
MWFAPPKSLPSIPPLETFDHCFEVRSGSKWQLQLLEHVHVTFYAGCDLYIHLCKMKSFLATMVAGLALAQNPYQPFGTGLSQGT